MRGARLAVALGVLGLSGGCAHAPALAPQVVSQLEATPSGYLAGEASGLRDGPVLENRDFVWALDFAPTGERVAYTHLGAKVYRLALWALGGPAPAKLADVEVNPYEFDVEAVAFSADGGLVATASRDGQVRLFDAASGASKGQVRLDEPLTAVAFHPGGQWLVVGSSRGLVSVLSVPRLGFSSEVRAHGGEPVSALAFAADGTLYSGGWDKHVRVWSTREEALRRDEARVRFERRGGSAVVRGTVNDKVPLAFALDARVPAIILRTEAAVAAGIDVAFLQDTLTVPTALGNTVARLARGQSLHFKALVLEGVDVAVCDTCVPEGVQGVLGAPFSARVDTAFDETTSEVLLTAKGAVPGTEEEAAKGLALAAKADFPFEAHVNDVTLDAKGQRLGVAFSESRAERTRLVYEREKKGFKEPPAPWNAAALVDAATGRVLHKWTDHAGVVATAAISPDGRSLASGGWDKRLRLFTEGKAAPVGERGFGWSVRRVRFSPDGRRVGVAAWTPQLGSGGESDPAAALFEVHYAAPSVERR
jgi:WD40 repeat protein